MTVAERLIIPSSFRRRIPASDGSLCRGRLGPPDSASMAIPTEGSLGSVLPFPFFPLSLPCLAKEHAPSWVWSEGLALERARSLAAPPSVLASP